MTPTSFSTITSFQDLSWRDRRRFMPTSARWILVLLGTLLLFPLAATGAFELLVIHRGAWGLRDMTWLVPTLNETARVVGPDLLPTRWNLFLMATFLMWMVFAHELLMPLSSSSAQELWRLTRSSRLASLLGDQIVRRRGTFTRWDLQALRLAYHDEQKNNPRMNANLQRRWARLHRTTDGEHVCLERTTADQH